jgi:zinc ribbon protein
LSLTPTENDAPNRELTIGEVFIRSLDLARRNYLRLLPIFAGFGVFAALASTYIREITPPLIIPTNVANLTQAQALALFDSFAQFIGYRTLNYFVEWLLLYFAAGIGVWKIFQLLAKEKKLGFDPPKVELVPLAVTIILTVFAIELSSFLLLVGLLVFGTLFYLAFPVAAAEEKYFFGALGKSRKLVSGKIGKTFLIFAGVQLFSYIAARVISTLVSLLPISSLAANAVLTFVLALEFPFVSASMVVVYLSYRSRQEWVIQKPPSLYDNMTPQPMGTFATPAPPVRRFCSSCGSSISPDERFCHNCGRPLMN